MGDFLQFDWSFIDDIGNNPFQAMWFFFSNGGWLILLWVCLWGARELWLNWRQSLYGAKREFIVLAINVPRTHEQGPRAVENMFAYLAGAHASSSWVEKWIDGRTQDTISCEIVSIDGHVQFFIRTIRKFRDLAEAAIYSQYPDAEIIEVEDYTKKIPSHYPDEEWEMWGTEIIPAKHGSDYLPIKTYPFFEDKVSGEFKDPLAALLESLARLSPGEQAWMQIILTPIDQKDFQKKAESMVKKLTGQKIQAKQTTLDKVVNFPIKTTSLFAEQLLGISGGGEKPKKDPAAPPSNILHMTQGEKDVVTAIENKASKIVFLTKIRFFYFGKKTIFSKAKIVQPFIGAIKQFNVNNMLSLKPETKKVGVNGTLIFFKNLRNNERKHHLVSMARGRSNWGGTPNYHLCTEELASLWHFPHALQVKSPQLKKTDSKRSEPPSNIPFLS